MSYRGPLEYAQARKIRPRYTPLYRLAHWPLWIWVFFLAPGPLTFSLFAHGFGRGNLTWLIAVLIGTGIAALRGNLPGAEPCPYILRFDEDKPNPPYRRVCYTFAWNAVLSFALLNLAGLIIAAATGTWYMKQIYTYAYFPLCATILLLRRNSAYCLASDSPRKEREPSAAISTAPSGPFHPTSTTAGRLEDPPRDTHSQPRQTGHLHLRHPADGNGGISRQTPGTRPIVPGELMVAD